MRCIARIEKGLNLNIGLDYDDTYTRDIELWNAFIAYARKRGHKVYLVTWRFPEECAIVHRDLAGKVDGIYPTSRLAKEKYMYSKGIRIDIWIDDNPSAVLNTMQGFEQ